MPGLKLPCQQPPKNICILRLSAIGDVCNAVAMVQQIQKFWPTTNISWIIGKLEASLLEGLPGVEFIIFDKKQGISEFARLRRKIKHHLRGAKFDILLQMQTAIRASLVSFCIPAAITVGFDRARAREGQWLFTQVKIPPQPSPHVVEGFLAFAQCLGIPDDAPRWVMPITKDERQWRSQHIADGTFYCVICPAASKPERNWLAERYAQVADYALGKGLKVVLCGGPTDFERKFSEQIISSYCAASDNHTSMNILNLTGKTSLKQLLAVLETATFVIAPDTGPAHMAVTVNTPVIGLYAHSNPHRTGPYRFQHLIVSVYEQMIQAQYGCDPSDIPWGKRAKGEDLMQHISVASVIEKIDQLV